MNDISTSAWCRRSSRSKGLVALLGAAACVAAVTGAQPVVAASAHEVSTRVTAAADPATRDLQRAATRTTLRAGDVLRPGSALVSSNRRFRATMLTNGNLVVERRDGTRMWTSRTSGHSGAVLKMTRTGNAVITHRTRTLWSSRTAPASGAVLVMRDDGSLVVRATSGKVLWSSEPLARGTYRVTVNGFHVGSETWDHAFRVDGNCDEVFLSVGTKVLDKDGEPKLAVTGGGDPASTTKVMGDVNEQNGRVQAGTCPWVWPNGHVTTGGLRTGDSFPTPDPWSLTGRTPTADRVPFNAGTFTLVDDQDTVVIAPSIWEWDGGASALPGWIAWFQEIAGKIPAPAAGSTAGVVLQATKLGLDLLVSGMDVFGYSGDRPIGITEQSTSGFKFDPTLVTLDYDAAEWLARTDVAGKGKGVLELQFRDHSTYRGHYTLYLQVTKVS